MDLLFSTIDPVEGSTPSSVVNATAPSPGVRLRITTEDGEDISGTRLGEKLFLRIEMDRESIFGIFARNLKVIRLFSLKTNKKQHNKLESDLV